MYEEGVTGTYGRPGKHYHLLTLVVDSGTTLSASRCIIAQIILSGPKVQAPT